MKKKMTDIYRQVEKIEKFPLQHKTRESVQRLKNFLRAFLRNLK